MNDGGHLDDLATFARIADLGSLTQAARALGLTPSSVSRSLKRLEERLGTRLLHRTTRQVALTEEGARFHRQVQRLLADLADAEAELRGSGGAIAGTLRISTFTAFGTESATGPVAGAVPTGAAPAGEPAVVAA